MPRHDRAYGVYHSFRSGGGKTTRRTRRPRNTYARKQATRSPIALSSLLEDISHQLGRKNGTSATPQAPKGGKGRPAPSVPNPKKPAK